MAPFSEGIDVTSEYFAQVCDLMKERAVFPKDIWLESKFFFTAPESYNEKIVRKKWKETTPQVMQELILLLEKINDFKSEQIEAQFKVFLEERNLGFGAVLPNFRLAVTGAGAGPSMFKISEILGKQEVLSRIKTAIQNISLE